VLIFLFSKISEQSLVSTTGDFKQLLISLLLGGRGGRGYNKQTNKQKQQQKKSGLICSQKRSNTFNGGSALHRGILLLWALLFNII